MAEEINPGLYRQYTKDDIGLVVLFKDGEIHRVYGQYRNINSLNNFAGAVQGWIRSLPDEERTHWTMRRVAMMNATHFYREYNVSPTEPGEFNLAEEG